MTRRDEIAAALRTMDEFAHGGRVDEVAREWQAERFGASDVRAWLDAGCFTAYAAAQLRRHRVTPEMASRRIEMRGDKRTIGYWLANRDLAIEQACRLARESR